MCVCVCVLLQDIEKVKEQLTSFDGDEAKKIVNMKQSASTCKWVGGWVGGWTKVDRVHGPACLMLIEVVPPDVDSSCSHPMLIVVPT